MSAKYIIRLDDACPTMDYEKWNEVEQILDTHKVRPVVAVIPENRDPNLLRGKYDPNFWDKVRSWHNKGWEIAMHGHTHLMHQTNAKPLLPFWDRSEFAGLPLDQQAAKLRQAEKVFKREGIRVRTWIAPAHSFDQVTLSALREATKIYIICDGIATRFYYDSGFYWVPQQFSRFKKMPFGLWTICLHPNEMDKKALAEFSKNVAHFSNQIIAFSDLTLEESGLSVIDHLFNFYFWIKRGKLRAAVRWGSK